MRKEKNRALVKNTGQVFTPDYIVDGMLDFCGYTGKAILGKHVIDNSCGDGAFLRPILRRYIEEALSCGIGRAGLKADLETYIHGNFYLAAPETLRRIRAIKENPFSGLAKVKNGFATLADKVFIGNVPDTSITIPVIKASTGKWTKGLCPYDGKGRPIREERLFAESAVREYFESHRAELQKDKAGCTGWFYYGRTQALKDVYTDKYAINCLVVDVNSVRLNFAPAGSGVYGGLYILTDVDEQSLRDAVECQEFLNYVASLKRYKSGGYYAFNSKDLEQYLNFRLAEKGIKASSRPSEHGQPCLFDC